MTRRPPGSTRTDTPFPYTTPFRAARSASKSLQAIALVESGAADAFALSPPELALACASHSGEPRHVETVIAWLQRPGLSAADLECGAPLPSYEPALIRSEERR